MLVLQTSLKNIGNLNRIYQRGEFALEIPTQWFLVYRDFKDFYIQPEHSCKQSLQTDFSQDKIVVIYYRLTWVEPKNKLVFVPGGQLEIDDQFDDSETNERPLHRVSIDGFCFDPTEVTNAQFCEFLNDSPATKADVAKWIDLENEFCLIERRSDGFISQNGFANHPVVEVSWHGARAFCDWLSVKEGRRYRLPTPEEWEWAAQGANHGRNGAPMPLRGNFHGSDGRIDKWPQLAPVDELPPDTLEIKGLWGNVWEWTQFLPGQNSTFIPQQTGSDAPNFQMIYGGSWLFSAEQIRAARRALVSPDFRSFAIGFRVVHPCRNDE